MRTLLVMFTLFITACSGSQPTSPTSPVFAPAPSQFRVRFQTTRGDFIVAVERALSPLGADRFYDLVRRGFYANAAVYRVVPHVLAQFGIPGNPKTASQWREAWIADEPARRTNGRGTLTLAQIQSRSDSRTTQVVINLADNAWLDRLGYAPIGEVRGDGMQVVDRLYSDYGECAPRGSGPDQSRVFKEGNEYLRASFPALDYISSASILAD